MPPLFKRQQRLVCVICSLSTTPTAVVSSRFVFIIGTSVVLSLTSMQKRGVSRLQLLRKVTWRTVVLLTLGFCFLNYSPRDGLRRCPPRASAQVLRVPLFSSNFAFIYRRTNVLSPRRGNYCTADCGMATGPLIMSAGTRDQKKGFACVSAASH